MSLRCAFQRAVFSLGGVHRSAALSAAIKVIRDSQHRLTAPPVARRCDGSSPEPDLLQKPGEAHWSCCTSL